jgi:hypothetical protein
VTLLGVFETVSPNDGGGGLLECHVTNNLSNILQFWVLTYQKDVAEFNRLSVFWNSVEVADYRISDDSVKFGFQSILRKSVSISKLTIANFLIHLKSNLKKIVNFNATNKFIYLTFNCLKCPKIHH